LDNNAKISSESESTKEYGGNAGEIIIAKKIKIERHEDGTILLIEPVESADSVRLRNDSTLTTNAEGAGGGKISIAAKKSLHLSDSEITTSVSHGEGGGGDISIRDTGAGRSSSF